MKQYFIHDGQQQTGPFDVDQLKTLSLKKDTLVWHDELERWTPAGELDELKPLMAATPPPLHKPTPPPITPSQKNTTNKKSNGRKVLIMSIVLIAVLLIVGAIGWLVYENNAQAESLTQVQENLTEQQNQQQQQEIAAQQLQAEKDRVNAELTEKYMGYRNNWANYITASSNRYTYSELGGISDLAVIVTNNTDKIIDEVQVKVDYIKANGGNYKSETVSVTNIGPNSYKSVSAPESSRGTSVNMSIVAISARSFHFCYPDGMDGNQDKDPYFCK